MLYALLDLPNERLGSVELLCQFPLRQPLRLTKLAQKPAQNGMLLPRRASNCSSQYSNPWSNDSRVELHER